MVAVSEKRKTPNLKEMDITKFAGKIFGI